MFFCRTNLDEWERIKNCLEKYGRASGQHINYQKSAISFNKNTPASQRITICSLLGILEVANHGHYLGLTSLIGKNKRKSLPSSKNVYGTGIRTRKTDSSLLLARKF